MRMEGGITSTPAGDSGLFIPTPRGGGARLMMPAFFSSLLLGFSKRPMITQTQTQTHTLTRAHPPPKAEPGHRRGHGRELRRRPLGWSWARQLRERRVLGGKGRVANSFFLSPRSLSPFPASREATRPLPVGLPRAGFVLLSACPGPRSRLSRFEPTEDGQGIRALGRAVASLPFVGLLLGGWMRTRGLATCNMLS